MTPYRYAASSMHKHTDHTIDIQNVPQQTPMQGEDTICISNATVNGALAPIPADKEIPPLSIEREQIPLDDPDYIPLTAPSCSPPGRREKRKIHQQYRPPTPPLPSHSRKHRTPDAISVMETPSSSIFHGNCESPYQELRRKHSTVAPSFTTSLTQSPSLQTEKTYISFVPSDRCLCWPKVRLHQFSKTDSRSSRSGLSVGHDTGVDEVSWWGKIGGWGASIGSKVKRFAKMYMC
ncbi:hypothetical protein C0993_000002 [Termitomyces sp. T159_Od127]|nr:hypothetical protein C0993_000002 [Termitomyces sp. T159_Od127]